MRVDDIGRDRAQATAQEGPPRVEEAPETQPLPVGQPREETLLPAVQRSCVSHVQTLFVVGEELGPRAALAHDVDLGARHLTSEAVEEGLGALEEGACELHDPAR